MDYKHILITGGAGFVGSNIAIKLKLFYPNVTVTCLDNLYRKGSELNVPRLKKHGVTFVKGDIRNKKNLKYPDVDLIIEACAEPSVLAGLNGSPEYVIDTNLGGAINCFELARRNGADIIFLSTSRVYPIELLDKLAYKEEDTRFTLLNQKTLGSSKKGISEDFPLTGVRSLYGATKLSSEHILQEYIQSYKMQGIINRFGLITGRWQMGKVDQGVVVLWMAAHVFNMPLSYIGYGGVGKQLRDVIDIDDVFDILNVQLKRFKDFNGQIYNIGGGLKNSISLCELTAYCREISGNKVNTRFVKKSRQNDIRIYISDISRITNKTRWKPKKSIKQSLSEIHNWIVENKKDLESILGKL